MFPQNSVLFPKRQGSVSFQLVRGRDRSGTAGGGRQATKELFHLTPTVREDSLKATARNGEGPELFPYWRQVGLSQFHDAGRSRGSPGVGPRARSVSQR